MPGQCVITAPGPSFLFFPPCWQSNAKDVLHLHSWLEGGMQQYDSKIIDMLMTVDRFGAAQWTNEMLVI